MCPSFLEENVLNPHNQKFFCLRGLKVFLPKKVKKLLSDSGDRKIIVRPGYYNLQI